MENKKKRKKHIYINIARVSVCVYNYILIFILIFIYRKMARRFAKVLEEEIEEAFFLSI